MGRTPVVHVDLATTEVEGRQVWCSELYLDGKFIHASTWRWHVTDAIRDGQWLKENWRSDLALAEAKREVAQLYARAS